MANNIEIKARVRDFDWLEAKARTIADKGPFQLAQDDTFFACPNGRLKLREFADGTAQLIFYQRSDQTGPKNSFYQIVPVMEPGALRESLSLAYGIVGRVVKHRTLYLVGRTRIHLDRVQGLGDFMELEVVLAPDESKKSVCDSQNEVAQSESGLNDAAAGEREAQSLMDKLGISTDDLVATAYVDLPTPERGRRD